MIPRATYRLQFHKGFTFADATAQADYFAALGVSHIYASPILTARAGSRHGYDVIDPAHVNPELGGEDGLRALALALKARGIGIIADIVPNHMAVGRADNRWWLDLLAKGRASEYARSFDIDWDAPGLENKVLAPFLDGDPDALVAKGDLHLTRDGALGWAFAYFEHRFPLRGEDAAALGSIDPDAVPRGELGALLARQHFVLADWRAADTRINWRRFFDITDLAAIRVGEPAVFEAVHAKIFALYGEGLIDGVRIDHIDGLADPRAYCWRLRQRLVALGREPYLIVEKILAEDEWLPIEWGTDGTTGYDFMDEVSALQHVADDGTLDRLWQVYGGRNRDIEAEEVAARREIVTTRFASQLAATARAFARVLPALPIADLSDAIVEIIVWLRCYRGYATGREDTPGLGAHVQAAIRYAAEHAPRLVSPVAEIAGLFSVSDGDANIADALRRFHQLSAPVAAKAVEDTALYRYGRLLSRNDVGFDPRTKTLGVEMFHARMQWRARSFPAAMLATATHDHKRGEDVRARLAALSERPQSWEAFVAFAFRERQTGLASGDVYQLFQTMLGIWPEESDAENDELVGRLQIWCRKFLREAKLRSNWVAPDTAYEAKFCVFARDLVTSPAAAPLRLRLKMLLAEIAPRARAKTLVQTVLRYTVPGMPDLYQGCEFWDLSLVDPDNRGPVDFASRAAALAASRTPQSPSALKQALIASLCALRAANPEFWRGADYCPLAVKGSGAKHIVAFERVHGDERIAVVALRHGARAQSDDTVIEIDIAGRHDFLTGRRPASARAAHLLDGLPISILVSASNAAVAAAMP